MSASRSLRSAAYILAVITGLVVGDRATGAGGTVHIWIGAEATQYVTDPGLRALLQGTQKTYYGMGLMFPDTADSILLVHRDTSEGNAHNARFLNSYLDRIRSKCGTNPNDWLADEECSKLLAHFMGSLGHIVGDDRFDHYFLMQVDILCEYNDGGSSSGSQKLTDFHLDNAVSCNQPMSMRPVLGYVPLTGCCSGFPLYQCCNEWGLLCYSFDCDLRRALRSAIPAMDYAPRLSMNRVQASVRAHSGILNVQRNVDTCLLGRVHVANNCQWAWDNVLANYGGIEDSGRVLGDYINQTWRILEAGGVPRFETLEAFPEFGLSVSESGDPWQTDYVQWIDVAGRVSKFQLEDVDPLSQYDDRIGWLADGMLYTYDGAFDTTTSAIATAPPMAATSRIVDFQLEGGGRSGRSSRVGVLIETAEESSGGVLAVRNEIDGWQTVAENVINFRLEGERIAVLVDPGDGAVGRELLVRESVASDWVSVAHDVVDFRLDGDRIAVVDVPEEPAEPEANRLRVKEGAIDAPWAFSLSGAIAQVELTSSSIPSSEPRVWVLDGGTVLLKEGSLDSEWVPQLENVSQMRVRGMAAGAVSDGRLSTMDRQAEWIYRVGEAAAPCPWDVNLDGAVDWPDAQQVLDHLGERCNGCPEDVNDDGRVNIGDFLAVVAHLGPCPVETVISDFDVWERPDCFIQDRFIAVDDVSPIWLGESTPGSALNRDGVPARGEIMQIGTDNKWRIGALIDDRLYVKQISDFQLRLGCDCWCRDD